MWKIFGSGKARELRTFTKEMMEEALLAFEENGAHFALLYANMGGHLYETIDIDPTSQRSMEFESIIQAEPAFTDVGRQYAVDKLAHGMEVFCNSSAPVFEKIAFGFKNQRNLGRKECLAAFKELVTTYGFLRACEQLEFDLGEFIERNSVKRRGADIEKITAKMEERKAYLKPLLLRALAQGKNKYGETEYKNYFKELREFLSYYFPENESLPFFFGHYPLMFCARYLVGWFCEAGDVANIPIGGTDFEYWCASRIEAQGWSARVTKASGDQGVDVEATKGGKTIVVQCKRYDQPAGNKAVQEVYAGMIHYRAQAACVICTSGFTASAIELARSTGVVLIDAQNISEFTSLLETNPGKGTEGIKRINS